MKNLLIMRHGSATGIVSEDSDINRTLTEVGEAEASIQGHFLEQAGIIPQFIAASSAVRACTTAEKVMESLPGSLELTVAESLYNALGEALLGYAQDLPHPVETALLVAHMPGVAELLAMVTSDFAEITVAYAPATLSCVSFPNAMTWEDVVVGSGRLEWLLPPLMLGR